jgi:Zn finger protein HypA/HybF involved in hydrogenase expression
MHKECKLEDLADRIRAIIAQAIAEAQTRGAQAVQALHIVLYESDPELPEAIRLTFEWASRDTPVQGAALVFTHAASRFICWNCCGLRFEALDGMCPNCGEVGILIPAELAFGLERVE